MKKITKTIPMVGALNEVAWYEKEKNSISGLSATARLALKRNMNQLSEIANNFYQIRDELQTELRNKYSTDEKSTETEVENADGSKVPGRHVKDEYLNEYQSEVAELQNKLNEVLADTEEVELFVIDLDSQLERIDQKDLEISDAAIDMLTMFEDIE